MPAVNLEDLRTVRKALSVSQREFASLLGISTRSVQSYEQGWRPTPPHVQKLAGLLLFFNWRRTHAKEVPCWKARDCDRAVRARCPAYQWQAGEFCWLGTGNSRHGQPVTSWADKLAECQRCSVMKPWLEASQPPARVGPQDHA